MRKQILFAAACLATGMFLSQAALADKPSWAGGGKHDGDDRQAERHDRDKGRGGDEGDRGARDRGHEQHGDARFNDDSRRRIADYYGKRPHGDKCPPGLAKKHNGCLPPGQAKKWAMGRALPSDVRYYDLPRDLVALLPPPPPQHRYVRVAGDILLVAVGTSVVVDAIEDIVH
jgi:Ni/Co efflux regulator RcnB